MKNNYLQYRDFIGTISFSAEDECFFGKIEGIQDLITFEGESVKELKKSFHFAVDQHIEDCKRSGKEIKKSFKGSFNIRIGEELHRLTFQEATKQGKSINHFIKDVLLEKFQQRNNM